MLLPLGRGGRRSDRAPSAAAPARADFLVDAALAALLAGVIGAVINTALSLVLLRLAGGAFEAEVRSAIEQNAQIPFEVRDRVLGILDRANLPLLQAAITLPTYALFGMLGGLLGTALFRRKTPPGVAS